MVRKRIESLREWLKSLLRGLCGRISPDVRVRVIVVMFLLFAVLSLWMTVSSIYRFGKGYGERIRIEHIEWPKPELRQMESQSDSVKQINDFYYEYGQSE